MKLTKRYKQVKSEKKTKKNPKNKKQTGKWKKQNYPKQDDNKIKQPSICVIAVLDNTSSWRKDAKETFQ